jgi:glycosyltransferase involved in cell wall biosynthesis
LSELAQQKMVSVIVPCYNQAQYLSEALESVLNQTYNDWECVIINDGSSDNTEEVANEWLIRDHRFKYVKIENGGLSNARNAGISDAEGELILPLDADDRIGQDYLHLAVDKFSLNENLKLVYCHAQKFGAVDEDWDLEPYSLEKLAKGNMIFCSSIFKKSDWERVRGFDVNMIYGWEDWEFWINILKDGGEVLKLKEVCFFYRIKDESMLKRMDIHKQKEMFNYMSLKHTGFYIERVGSFIELSQQNSKYKNQIEQLENRIKIKDEITIKDHLKKALKLIINKVRKK